MESGVHGPQVQGTGRSHPLTHPETPRLIKAMEMDGIIQGRHTEREGKRPPSSSLPQSKKERDRAGSGEKTVEGVGDHFRFKRTGRFHWLTARS